MKLSDYSDQAKESYDVNTFLERRCFSEGEGTRTPNHWIDSPVL